VKAKAYTRCFIDERYEGEKLLSLQTSLSEIKRQ
jgi:hypothetical protein